MADLLERLCGNRVQKRWSGERGSNPRPQLWELADNRLQLSTVVHGSFCSKLRDPAECTQVHILPWENRGNMGKRWGHSGLSRHELWEKVVVTQTHLSVRKLRYTRS